MEPDSASATAGSVPLVQVRGRRLIRLGAASFWVALVLFVLTTPLGRFIGYAVLALDAALLAVVFLGLAIMRRGRKLMASSGEELLRQDSRPPVVYLRPFTADELGTRVATRYFGWRYFTEEEQLAMVMNEIGPFIAIGDPRETVADLGAARIYARDGGWEHKVLDLVSKARLILLRAGTSEGFLYELQAVRSSTSPAQVLLLMPADRTEYEAFRERAGRVFPHPLPEWTDVGRQKVLENMGPIIEFIDDWRPRTLPVIKTTIRAAWTAPHVARLKLTLKPVFERLGVPFSAPPVHRARTAFTAAGAVIALLAFAVSILINPPGWLEDLFRSSDDYAYTARTGSTYNDAVSPEPTQAEGTPANTPDAETTGNAQEVTAYDQALERMAARLEDLPEMRALARRMTNRTQAQSMSRELTVKGMHRLNDARLLERVEILGQVVELADAETCASMLTRVPSPGLEAALRQLDTAEINRFFEITYDAIVAELRRQPAPPSPSEDEVVAAWQAMFRLMRSEEMELIVGVFKDPAQAPAEQACQAARSVYLYLPRLAESHRSVLARAMVSIE